MWNGILTTKETGYCVTGDVYNLSLEAGASVIVGYTANGTDAVLSDIQLSCKQTENVTGLDSVDGNSYTAEDYLVEISIADSWQNGYNAVITVTNTSEETIHNWGFLFKSNDTISDLYNAVELSKTEDNVRLIRNNRYNQDIPAGGSVTFGYTGTYEGTADVPAQFLLATIETAVSTESFLVSTITGEEWEDGSVVHFIAENTSDQEIEDWVLEFDSTAQIQQLWNGVILSHTGNHYVIQNPDYAQNIAAGETLVVGAVLSGGMDELQNVTMREVKNTESVSGGSTSGNTPSGNTPSDNTPSSNTPSENTVSGNGSVSNANIMEGINYLDHSDGTALIYYKEAFASDVILSSQGIPCIKNQILLSVDLEIPFETVQEYANLHGMAIVGYMEPTNDYQLEFYCDTEIQQIEAFMLELEEQSWVRMTSLNYEWLEEAQFYTTDPWDEEGNISDYDGQNPSGSNWGLELIDFEGALIAAGVIPNREAGFENIQTDHLSSVKLGVLDSMFAEWHEDLNFEDTYNNYTRYNISANIVSQGITQRYLGHGTHVAGIMAAEFNNATGMTGICVKNELYGYALNATDADLPPKDNDEITDHTFKVASGLEKLVALDVRVINYSYGGGGCTFQITNGTESEKEDAIEYLTRESVYVENILNNLMTDHDFLIVTSAGNENNVLYYKVTDCSSHVIDYVPVIDIERGDSTEEVDKTITYGAPNTGLENAGADVEARYSNVFTWISEESNCYDRIICVGAVDNGSMHRIASFSNVGERVDVYAPGVAIYSTYCSIDNPTSETDYSSKKGTSMAAPMVVGVAGLAYNVNPALTAEELKESIIRCARGDIGIVNAADVIRDVQRDAGGNPLRDESLIQLHIVDENGNAVPNAEIEITRGATYWEMAFGTNIRVMPAIGNSTLYDKVYTDEAGNAELYLQAGSYCILYDQGSVGGGKGWIAVYDGDCGQTSSRTFVLKEYSDDYVNLNIQLFDISRGNWIRGATIYLREGWDQRSGTYAEDCNNKMGLVTDQNGNVHTRFQPGCYIVEIRMDGKVLESYNITISETFNYCRFEL